MGLANLEFIRRPAISVWPNCAKTFTNFAGDKKCIKVTPSQQVGKNFRVPADTTEDPLPGVRTDTQTSIEIGCLQQGIMPRFISDVGSGFDAPTLRCPDIYILIAAVALNSARSFDSHLEQVDSASRSLG